MLNRLELVELKVGIDDREEIPGLRMFVNEYALPVAEELFLDLEEPFALEHDRQDITGWDITRIVEFNQLAQKRFRCLLLDGFGFRRGSFIDALPIGNKTFAVPSAVTELLLPARLADVHAPEIRFFVEDRKS